jgi:hypothetical protein
MLVVLAVSEAVGITLIVTVAVGLVPAGPEQLSE